MAQTPAEGITKQGQGYVRSLCCTARAYAVACETLGHGSDSAADRSRTPPPFATWHDTQSHHECWAFNLDNIFP